MSGDIQSATCLSAGGAASNGKMTIYGFESTDRYDFNIGSTYTGSATYATATAIPVDGVLSTTLPNPSTSDTTYTVRVINAEDCSSDLTFKIYANTCPTPCDEPNGETITVTSATCTGLVSNDDATISISGVTDGDKIGIFAGGPYAGPNYASADILVAGAYTYTALSNPVSNRTYTIRIFNGADDCYVDRTAELFEFSCGLCSNASIEIIEVTQNDSDSYPANSDPTEDDMAIFEACRSTDNIDLELSKTVSPTSGTTASTFTYTLMLTNTGTMTATDIQVNEDFPFSVAPTVLTGNLGTSLDSLSIQSSTASIGTFGLTQGWMLDSLQASQSATLTIDVRALISGTYENCAYVTNMSPDNDPDSTDDNDATANEDDDDCASITVTGSALPSISKEFSPMLTKPNTPTRLTLKITNPESTDITLTSDLVDVFPSSPEQMVVAATTNFKSNLSGVTVNTNDTQITIPSGTVLPSGLSQISVDVTVPSEGDYCNDIAAGDLQTSIGNNLLPSQACIKAYNSYVMPPVTSVNDVCINTANEEVFLTMTIDNRNATNMTLDQDFINYLPDDLVMASGTNIGTISGLTAFTAGDTSFILLAGSIIQPGEQTIIVLVTSATTACYNNIIYMNALLTSVGGFSDIGNQDIAEARTAPCELYITAAYSDNCSGDDTNGYTADWNIGFSIENPPDTDISYQRNSDAVQSHTLTGTTDTLTVTGIPADGGIYDTVTVWFTNDTTCADTIILKRPVPCPTNLGSNSGEICSTVAATEIVGTVWEDWDYDGIMDETDTIGVQGIAVYLYDCDGNVVDTTYTDSNGNYEFTGLGSGPLLGQSIEEYRVEFIKPDVISCWAQPTQAGMDNGTTVQLVQPGNCASLGVANPADYCSTTNPFLATTCFIFGGIADPENYKGVVDFEYDWRGSTFNYPSAPNEVRTVADVGAVYGLAYQRSTNTLFAATIAKRHTIYGPGGFGAIYILDSDITTPDFITVPNAGTTTHNTSNYFHDENFFPIPGKESLGDIDLSEDGKHLYAINLNNTTLYQIDVETPGSASYGTVLNTFSITGPNCNNGVFVPYALEIHKGKIYVGGVCNGETGGSLSDLSAHVLELIGTSFIEVFSMDLDYIKGSPHSTRAAGNTWHPWETTWAGLESNWDLSDIGGGNFLVAYPQPVLSDMEIDVDGSLILGFRDLIGDQIGANTGSVTTSDSDQYAVNSTGGDIKRACWINGGWVVEGTGACPNNYTASNGGSQPAGTVEYYPSEVVISGGNIVTHFEIAQGGLTLLPQFNTVATTAVDAAPDQFNAGGVLYLNNTTGEAPADNTRGYNVFHLPLGTYFGKANGLGDLETLCEIPPLEIGNYVWKDTDGDGIQNACEPGLSGVNVTLYGAVGDSLTTVQTDANGQYYFNFDTPGLDTLLPDTMYFIVVGESGQFDIGTSELTLSGTDYTITLDSIGQGSLPRQNDSDGTLASGVNANFDGQPYVKITTGSSGEVDHTFDFGFVPENCKEITQLITNRIICSGELADTLSITTTYTNPDNIAFVYFMTAQTDSSIIYMGGTGIDTVQIALGNDTVRIFNISGFTNTDSTPDTFYVYGIAHPTPTDNTCRPYEEILVIVNPQPSLNTTDTVSICPSFSVDLTNHVSDLAGLSGYIAYYPSLTDANIQTNVIDTMTVNPSTTTTYYVRKNAPAGDSTVVINEVEYSSTDQIELMNYGDTTVNISNYWFCSLFSYAQLNSLTIISGDLDLASGERVVLSGFALNDAAADLGLYNINTFTSTTAMEDFIQWGSGGNGRESVADTKGIWTIGDFIPTVSTSGNSIEYDGSGNTSADWTETVNSLGDYNTNSAINFCSSIDSIIVFIQDCDWGDLPDSSATTNASDYQTLSANNGPVHVIIPGLNLGTSVDSELDGQPSTDALGDGSDENGVTIFSSLDIFPGSTFRLPLNYENTTGSLAHIEAWIDWNGDGDFDEPNEMVFDVSDIGDSAYDLLSITSPNDAVSGQFLGFRIRISNQDNMAPYGLISEGEIEDYLIGLDCPTQICVPMGVQIKRK